MMKMIFHYRFLCFLHRKNVLYYNKIPGGKQMGKYLFYDVDGTLVGKASTLLYGTDMRFWKQEHRDIEYSYVPGGPI